ncbi:MAG TPA: hypothetical protein VFO41_06325 [Alphaproteobacteria bacterium]|nr:hypothetical protein [Alphaproteobacteria bacterium]
MLRFALAPVCALLMATAAWAQTGADRAPASREEALRSLEALDRAVANPLAGACLARPEAMADTVIRLHTELMQASLACADAYGDPEAYGKYRQFTRRHADILRASRRTMVDHLSGRGDGEFLFDAYRTALANEESRFLNRFRTERYCAIRESRFRSLIDATPEQFEAYAAEVTGRALAGPECQ